MKKLNLGCGNKPKEGWVNLDIVAYPGVDVVWDMTKLPLPFADNEFDLIYAEQVLDHFRALPVIKELHRILAPGGKLEIEVVHFSSARNYTHLEHVQLYSADTFEWYVPGTKEYSIGYWYAPFVFTACTRRYITFDRSSRWFYYNKFIEKWVNKNKKRQQRYEATGFCHLFPAEHLYFTLVK